MPPAGVWRVALKILGQEPGPFLAANARPKDTEMRWMRRVTRRMPPGGAVVDGGWGGGGRSIGVPEGVP